MGNIIFKQMHGLRMCETNGQVSEDFFIRFSSLVRDCRKSPELMLN